VDNIILTPKVDPTQEFIEISQDFSNPLDIVREAISNGFDAHATCMELLFFMQEDDGETVFVSEIKDNGDGMDIDGLQSFFDLGNSLRRKQKKENPTTATAIGEKGHGSKIYLDSNRIEVITVKKGSNIKLTAIMDMPKKKLYKGELPTVSVKSENCDQPSGTSIKIVGYNGNVCEAFTHDRLKDYIKWFTKVGSVELEFDVNDHKDFILVLKGIDKKAGKEENISFGHIFPPESESIEKLLDKYLDDAPNWYCKRIKKSGNLKSRPDIEYEAVFYIEGTKVKHNYNNMIRQRASTKKGTYQIQERYGLWLCKDYMPIQRKNEWITNKGSEFTKFHAFVNCQGLRLTANRGSIDNTPHNIIDDLGEEIKKHFDEIIESNDWYDITWLDRQAQAHTTSEKEKKDFAKRIKRINSSQIADWDGLRLVAPKHESGVVSMLIQIQSVHPNMFPFYIVDYDTHSGYDAIVKARNDLPIKTSDLYYIEFKKSLGNEFNHSFENLHSIVCWNLDSKCATHGSEVTDIADVTRTLEIIPPEYESDYTRYYLNDRRRGRKIEVFVLQRYLQEKYRVSFRTRTEQDIL